MASQGADPVTAVGRPSAEIPDKLLSVVDDAVDEPEPTLVGQNLEQWADQGVLMLNTVLTVREGEPNSHHGQGWEDFTGAVLKKEGKPVEEHLQVPLRFTLSNK